MVRKRLRGGPPPYKNLLMSVAQNGNGCEEIAGR